MKMHHATSLQPAIREDQTLQLIEEIAALESRLEDMGMDGDCAYERAISRVYAVMVEERKQQLAALCSLRRC
jgi:hypothetical protein